MKIWKFELKKLRRRKLFLLLALIAITCVALIFFRNYWAEDKIIQQTLDLIEPHNGSITQILNTYKEERLFREESDTLDEGFLTKNLRLLTNFHTNKPLIERIIACFLVNLCKKKQWTMVEKYGMIEL